MHLQFQKMILCVATGIEPPNTVLHCFLPLHPHLSHSSLFFFLTSFALAHITNQVCSARGTVRKGHRVQGASWWSHVFYYKQILYKNILSITLSTKPLLSYLLSMIFCDIMNHKKNLITNCINYAGTVLKTSTIIMAAKTYSDFVKLNVFNNKCK